MSERSGLRSTWASRLALVCCLGLFAAFPIVLYRLAGGMPGLPRLPTAAAFRAFTHSNDDQAFVDAVLKNAERLLWVLWFYFALCLVMAVIGQIAEYLGRPALRAVWEAIQPRSVVAATNLVMVLVLAATPRPGRG